MRAHLQRAVTTVAGAVVAIKAGINASDATAIDPTEKQRVIFRKAPKQARRKSTWSGHEPLYAVTEISIGARDFDVQIDCSKNGAIRFESPNESMQSRDCRDSGGHRNVELERASTRSGAGLIRKQKRNFNSMRFEIRIKRDAQPRDKRPKQGARRRVLARRRFRPDPKKACRRRTQDAQMHLRQLIQDHQRGM